MHPPNKIWLSIKNRNRCNKRLRLLTKILLQLGRNNSSCIHREAFVFVRSSTTEKFLFVVGGECYFNVGVPFFFLFDERGECFGALGVFFFFQ